MQRTLSSWGIRANKLTFQLTAAAVLVVVAGTVVGYLLAVDAVRDALQEQVGAQQLALAKYVAQDVDRKVLARKELLERMAQDMPLDLLTKPAALQDWLEARHRYAPLFSFGLVVIERSGVGAVADFPAVPGRRKLDFNDRDWFIVARDSGAFAIGKPGVGRAVGQGVINMSAPIKDASGQVVAVLMGVTALNAPGFLDLIENNQIAKTGTFLLLDMRNEVIIAATDPKLRLKPTPAPGVNRIHDLAMTGWRGSGRTVNAFGVDTLASFASVPSTQWAAVARVPTAEAFSPVNAVMAVVIRNGLIAAFVLLVVLVLTLNYKFKPLRRAAGSMLAMASGNTPLAPLPVVRNDEVGEMVESFNLLVGKLVESEAQITHLALHDALTGLPNRREFMQRFKQNAALALRQDFKLALLFIDLDGFKQVNDQHGHKVGDALLKQVAQRLQESIRQTDAVGRIGGDEFLLLLNDCHSPAEVEKFAHKLVASLAVPYELGDRFAKISASVGIAIFPDMGQDVEQLLVLADAAMYNAKHVGRNGFRLATLPGASAATGELFPR